MAMDRECEGTNAVGHGLSQEGTYTIEVRDNATGCFDTQSVALNVLPNLFLDAFVVDPLICRGDSTEIVVEVFTLEGLDAFELPVFFEWDAPLVQGYQPTVAGGEYTATAQNGCGTSRVEVVVEEEYCGCDVYVQRLHPRWRWAQRGLQGAHGVRIRHV